MWATKKSKRPTPRKLAARIEPQSMVAEQYRTIRTNINFSVPGFDTQTILFTSASKEEGKSTTASNMAIVFAEAGKRVLLVDADMRRPTLHYTFKSSNRIGLANLLMKKGRFTDTVKQSGIKNLDLLMCGHIPPNPAELLSSPVFDSLLNEMKMKYDLIIFDSPPILSVTDSLILANKCDATVLVVNTGKTEKQMVIKARDALASAKAFIVGVVLNNYKISKDSYYYQNYGN